MFLLALSILCVGLSSLLFFSFLLKIKHQPRHRFRNCLFVSSRKSHSDAILLGGIGINLAALTAVILPSMLFDYTSMTMLYALPSFLIIHIHGYLDDRFEISPRFKLLCQLLSVGIFTVLAVPHLPMPAFVAAPLWFVAGFAVLNGANLLDGLDTMQLKLSALSLFFYFAVAIQFHNEAIVVASLLSLSSLVAFYPFNREPAKIHMGEIGANTLGMLFLVLSTESFIHNASGLSLINSFVLAAIPLALPVVELSTSFIRRIANRKSPFKSDRLHIHHILTDHYHFSAGGSATIIMVTFALIGSITLLFSRHAPIFAFCFEYFTLYLAYLQVGIKIWSHQNNKPTFFYAAKMTRLKKKELTVIDSACIDQFQFTIYQQAQLGKLEENKELPLAG